jgi:putative membrane protein
MVSLLLRVVVNAVALWVASEVVSGITVGGATGQDRAVTLLLVAIIFGLVNAVIRPVVRLIALPLYVLTLGLITFVINALMLLLTSWLSRQTTLEFNVDGFGTALLASLVVTIVSWVLNLVLPERD